MEDEAVARSQRVRPMKWFRDRVLLHERSTRAVGLLRIALALLVWHRFGADVAPWADNLAPDRLALAVSFYLSTTLMLVGLFSRVATAWTAATLLVMYFHYAVNGETRWFEHHTYLLTAEVTLLALTPCGRSYSLDRWIALNRGRHSRRSDRCGQCRSWPSRQAPCTSGARTTNATARSRAASASSTTS
jgi:hypothetical protein